MKAIALGGAVFAASVATAACSVTVDSQTRIQREEKRFTTHGAPTLRLTTFDGSIVVRSWDRSDVAIEIEKRGPTRESLEALEVVAEQDGDAIELEVKKPRTETFSGFGFHRTASAHLVVSLPFRSDVRARTGDGA